MTTQIETALLIDLYSGPSSSSTPDHLDHVKTKITNTLGSSQASCETVHLYILTPSSSHACYDRKDFISDGANIEVTVVEAKSKIESFYKAKLKLDMLDITKIRVMCDAGHEEFWTIVCQLLLTPVHEWDVEAVTTVSPNTNDALKPSIIQTGVESDPASTSHPASTDTVDSIKAQIENFMQTLPSMLGPPEFYRSDLLPGRQNGFVHGYSTRRGGVTVLPTLCGMNMIYTDRKRESRPAVEENRRRLGLVGNFDPENYHIVRVEHGHKVWTVGEDQPVKFDALITNRRDVTIAAAGADCIPLLFVDPVAMVIGAAHAGWKGSVERVAECVVKAMGEKFGSNPQNIWVAMGPCVGLGCFKIPKSDEWMFTDIHPSCIVDSFETDHHKLDENDFQTEKLHSVRSPGDDFCQTGGQSLSGSVINHQNGQDNGHIEKSAHSSSDSVSFRVQQVPTKQLKPKTPPAPKNPQIEWVFPDLQLTNYHVLLQAGVKAEHIDMSTSHCTKCNPGLFFSCDRDGFPFGNQIGFVCMPSGNSA